MSGSQKFVFVISILNVIGGAILIILGIVLAIVGGSSGGGDEAVGLAITGLLLGILGVIEIIGGVLGIRAARDAKKYGPFYVISLISFVLSILGFIVSIVNTGFHLSSIGSMILPALMFYCARNIKSQARM